MPGEVIGQQLARGTQVSLRGPQGKEAEDEGFVLIYRHSNHFSPAISLCSSNPRSGKAFSSPFKVA
ncbi:MAG: hypothetical protein PHW87_12305 [Methanothrix sp.]|nr:hypothetical protein [Methanothrix sp.]